MINYSDFVNKNTQSFQFMNLCVILKRIHLKTYTSIMKIIKFS